MPLAKLRDPYLADRPIDITKRDKLLEELSRPGYNSKRHFSEADKAFAESQNEELIVNRELRTGDAVWLLRGPFRFRLCAPSAHRDPLQPAFLVSC